jgi:large subunit ribosomal protein L10
LRKEEKEAFVTWLKAELDQAPAAVVAEYRGLTVAKMTALRGKCRESGVKIKVVKNTLTKRAVEGTAMAAIGDLLTGPTALAWHAEDPGAAARVLVEFAKLKGNEALVIKGAAASGKAVSAQEVDHVLAKLPTRDQLLSTFAFLMAGAGAARLHRLLKSGPAKLYNAMNSLKQQREGQA